MFTLKRLIGSSLLVGLLTLTALAQESRAPIDEPVTPAPVASAPLVTATATARRVRFVSPGTVVQLRLEVYNEAGQKLFDTELDGGNVLDWHLQDGAGQRVQTGSYACVLTTKSLSGRLSQRVGSVTVNDEKAAVETAAAAQLSMAQQQTIGPVEGNAGFTVLQESEPAAMTAVTHDGTEGQVGRTRGALSFRMGDFFSGKDKEQMRLTEEGRLGIGTGNPQTTLDVAGTIRAERILIAKPGKPGSFYQMSATDTAQSDAGGAAQPLASGSGTQNQIAKWIDNLGTLGDSVITETAGNVGIGTAAPGYPLTIVKNYNGATGFYAFNTTNGSLAQASGGVSRTTDFSSKYFTWGVTAPSFSGAGYGETAYFHSKGLPIKFGTMTADNLYFFTNGIANTRMTVSSAGNVGIGTATPTQRLDVVGNIKASGSLTGATANVVNQLTVDTNTLVVDAANNRVGIGTLTPTAPLDVVGDINTSTRYNIAGSRVLSNAGVSNLFAGVGAGAVNTGGGNAFFGSNAGVANTSGSTNSFFGKSAGAANTTAQGNSFFGADAGLSNTGGQNNSFFGLEAGDSNTNGTNNAFFGAAAGAANTMATGNSFFGFAAGQANITGDRNSFFGDRAGASNTASTNSFFGSTAGNLNTTGADNSFFGSAAGSTNSLGSSNSFFGANAGLVNITNDNSFFGKDAGKANTDGGSNSFFGKDAGLANTDGESNSFFGKGAGAGNTGGEENSFFGRDAGLANTDGESNAFFGKTAGEANTDGDNNSFFGADAGDSNTIGEGNSSFGRLAGGGNTSGASNTFVGKNAGLSNTIENSNTFLGAFSNGAPGITNATAVGANAIVTQSDSLVLGNGVKVGAGVSAPREKLQILGNIFIDGGVASDNGVILKSPDGATCAKLTISNAGALVTTVITCPPAQPPPLIP